MKRSHRHPSHPHTPVPRSNWSSKTGGCWKLGLAILSWPQHPNPNLPEDSPVWGTPKWGSQVSRRIVGVGELAGVKTPVPDCWKNFPNSKRMPGNGNGLRFQILTMVFKDSRTDAWFNCGVKFNIISYFFCNFSENSECFQSSWELGGIVSLFAEKYFHRENELDNCKQEEWDSHW